MGGSIEVVIAIKKCPPATGGPRSNLGRPEVLRSGDGEWHTLD